MLAGALVLAAAAARADVAPQATATASKTEVGVGETFTVDVAATGPAGTDWTFPAQAGDDDVELRTPPLPSGAGLPALPPGTHRYEAVAFALRDVEVPAVTVKYRLPTPDASPWLSVTTHAIVCTPLASAVVSSE